MTDPIRVLFLCTHNSARSQIAEALLRRDGGDRYEAFSAGTVATRVRPETVEVLGELGIDWSAARSKTLAEFLDQPFDYVITVCDDARDACPVFPGARRMLHWNLVDPSAVEGTPEDRLAAFRATVEDIESRLGSFIDEASRAHVAGRA